MAPQTTVGASGTTFMAEPMTTRIESAGATAMEQQSMPATTYSAPATTYMSGAQAGVMMGGPVHQEGFLQHAMHTVGNAMGLGGSQAGTTYVQGGQPGTTYVQDGRVTIASAPAGAVTSIGSVQTPVVYGATTGGCAAGGAGSASMFDQIDTNHDGVISRAEFAQVVQQ